MTDYQALLDETVALVQAERGFVVLCDATSQKPTGFAASYNFDVIAAQQPVGEDTGEEQYIWESLPSFFTLNQALITTNAIRDSYYCRRFRAWPWSLRSVIIVPLMHEPGLLWCDAVFKNRVFTPQDLQQVIALVEMRTQV